MAKIVEGAALIAGAVIATVLTGGLASPLLLTAWGVAIAGTAVSLGASLLLGGISQALQAGPSLEFSIKQPSAYRQIVYGQMRVAGTIVYEGSSDDNKMLNQVIVWAAHACQSIDTLYLDGRALFTSGDSGTHFDDSGNSYDFKGKGHFSHSLGPVPGTYFSDLGGRDSNWSSACTLDGLTASYIRCEFDQTVFPSQPGIKANIHGKNDIYDPRTGTRGYTNNAALIIADVLCNSEFGLGCDYATRIDEDALITAANLCDEQVALAAGGTESRYTLNGFFDTSSTPGDIIDAMLACCAGRLSYQGGKFQILVGAWYGSGLEFWDYDIVGPVKWSPKRKYRDLNNAIRATYIAPKHPYATVGYDQDHRDSSIFGSDWQPADAPEYAQDVAHGYDSDANLTADGNVKLYTSRSYRFCTSVSMAQRLMKIDLMRNRQQGSGTLKMSLSAYLATAGDVIQQTFAGFSWDAKYLEIQSLRFISSGSSSDSGSGDSSQQDVPTLQCEVQVCETDPSVYLWSTSEERTPENSTSPAIANRWSVNPPTNLILESGLDSAVVGTDGVTIPRIQITWIEPDDPFTLSGGHLEIQWQWANDTANWHSLGYFGPTTNIYFMTGVVCGVTYNVRIRAIRSNGASSDWTTALNHVVSSTAVSNITIGHISGLGSLASKNFVDFSSADVANKHAANLQYSTGISVEALRPAESGAEITTGKSIDILTDGGTYSRVKGNQLVAGIISGKSYGSNFISNPSFESNKVGSALNAILSTNWSATDDWKVAATGSGFEVYVSYGYSNSGNNSLLLRVAGAQTMAAGATARVVSPAIPVIPGSQYYIGGKLAQTSSAGNPLTSGLVIQQRIGLIYTDANGGWLGDVYPPDQVAVGNGTVIPGFSWTLVAGVVTIPSNASYIQMECAAFNTGSTQATAGGISCDCHFDDVFCNQVYGSSSILSTQGSILPNQTIQINYTYTKNSISFTWLAQSIVRSDGSSISVPAGSLNYTGLAPSRDHYTYWRVNASTGALGVTFTGYPPLAPNSYYAATMANDGYVPVGPIMVTTLDLSNDGTGSGTGGGSGLCPEANELVDIEGKGQIMAGDVKPGDKIKGKSIKTGEDVYREVLQISTEASVAWRMINGHRVSPCESVYWDGEWVPAYRVTGATVDEFLGTKILMSVASDEYDEQNYYLLSGVPLLIHNYPILPC